MKYDFDFIFYDSYLGLLLKIKSNIKFSHKTDEYQDGNAESHVIAVQRII